MSENHRAKEFLFSVHNQHARCVRYPVAKKAVDFHCSNVAVNDAGLSYFLSFGPLYYGSMLLHIPSLRNRRHNKIAAISRLLRGLLSYLQPGNAGEQSAAADVGLRG